MSAPEAPDIGPLHLDHEWRLERLVLFGGSSVPVRFESATTDPATGEPAPPSAVQRAAARLALDLAPDALEAAAPAVVQNYEVYREMVGDDEMPALAAPVDVWSEVTPASILVPDHGDVEIPTFLLMAECTWDPEHGLVVRFRDGHADAADQQGELWL